MWCGDITTLPVEILDLVRLKHIKMIKSTSIGGVKLPLRPERLSNILTLTSIHAGDGFERVPRIAQSHTSQKIGSEGWDRRECRRAACFGLQNLLHLSLEAKHTFNQGTLILSHTFSPPPLLRKLRLEGILQKLPDWIGSMDSLTNLRLGFSSVWKLSIGNPAPTQFENFNSVACLQGQTVGERTPQHRWVSQAWSPYHCFSFSGGMDRNWRGSTTKLEVPPII